MKYIAKPDNTTSYKKIRLIVVGVLLLAIIAASSIYFIRKNQAVALLDTNQVKQATFPIYVPKEAPEGYSINQKQVKLGSRSLGYQIDSDDGRNNIIVTVQPLPKNFNMSKMIGDGSVDKINTDNGTLYNLSAAGKNQYLLNTGDALVFFTATKSINTATINSLASNLKKQN